MIKGEYNPNKCQFCRSGIYNCEHIYNEKPKEETDFKFENYYRELWRCTTCSHFISTSPMDLKAIYHSDYVDRTYGGNNGILSMYNRIMNMDKNKSDNHGRVNGVIDFAKKHFDNISNLKILDIGSGLGVFLGKIKQYTDWNCTALEPDERLAKHAVNNIGVESISADYRDLKWSNKFDIITLNKVLEHIEHPIEMLKRCKNDLKENGFIYIELPDCDSALNDKEGYYREEFFVEHHHIFSILSMELMIRKANLKSLILQRLQEPSNKYTLRAFCTH